MSCYFDEHNCEEGSRPNNTLHLARLLLDTGAATDAEFERMFLELIGRGEVSTPPASEAVISALPRIPVSQEMVTEKEMCPVCLDKFRIEDPPAMAIKLQCRHTFCEGCLGPWLRRTATCPVCRKDLPTDDPMYEEYKRQKKRAAERETDIEQLHNSMFG